MRLRLVLPLLALLPVAAGCDLGPFGEDAEVEDHRFLVDLRNRSLLPVTIGVLGEASGFEVQGLSTTTIQRQVDPGMALSFFAEANPAADPPITVCSYRPPSDATPRREVQWDGSALVCLNWD